MRKEKRKKNGQDLGGREEGSIVRRQHSAGLSVCLKIAEPLDQVTT